MKRWLLVLALLPLAGWALLYLWPAEPPAAGYGRAASRVVLAADGTELATAEHPARVAGPWLEVREIPRLLAAAALAAEDRWFHWHPGVNPLALLRAAAQDLVAGRVVSGGSTITMQLARLLRPAKRGLAAKLREAVVALWLERRLSKDEILCQYLNRAPFGGPLVGVAAAARVLWGKHPARLGPAEAALLMSLPKDPSRLLKPAARPRLRRRRDRILRAMAAAGDLSGDELARALAAPIELKPPPRPATVAPHFVRRVLSVTRAAGVSRVATYLDPELQRAVSALAADLRRRRSGLGLRQAAVVVLRNRDRAVLAWVGSADFHDPASGQVDGVIARRQPGSALKPFIYAMALQRGRTLADPIEDSPLALAVAGGAFRPSDYDGVFRGTVSLRTALASSLNLPALRLAVELTPAAVLRGLRRLGFHLPLSANHYGVGLALGDGEVSLLEMAQAYAALADGGRWRPAVLWRGQKPAAARRVLDPYACRLVTDALADDRARALGFGRHGVLELPFPAAVKTGTSQQHRDNWCVGFTRDYTVAVWVGNFEGRPMAGVSGVSGAGPLWRQVMLLLHRHRPGELPPWPPGITWARACIDYQAATHGGCRAWRSEAFMPGTGPAPVGESADPGPRPLEVSLLTPVPGAIYALDPDLDPKLRVLHCRVAVSRPVEAVTWRLDGRPVAPGDDPLTLRLRLEPGRHRLVVRARRGRETAEAAVRFTVLPPAPPLRAARR